ncbi:MAG TPA: Asp-tRNA(Asn)/Glu-tRNA(Gln) amidotransferase subunit GatA [Candidatus Paceibacterota bacterium]|nr:Asp-tRNA(Asn)/Glu-tRNA(Gln) amidotransferase subunit GatA [Candidatus Paceibacterota bacterium]
MEPLHDLTIKKFHEGLINKKFSALEVAQATFAYIKEKDKEIGAYLSLSEESALHEAEAVDLAIAKNEEVAELAGVPMAIKDAILVKDQPATAASKILEHYTASYDAGVIKKLREAHAVFLGKTNMDEFAMGSSTENSAFKITRNPHDLTRVPGGSSGGSAAAVAAHLAVAALGSDTGGSIREPAAFCGVVGLKPTYGAVSRSGLIAMASSLDQIGPFAKTVEDAAIVFRAIAGHDPLDATSQDSFYKDLTAPVLENIRSLKVGLPEEYFVGGTDPAVTAEVESAIKKLTSLGITFKKISFPHTKYALSTYYIVMPAEVSSNLARLDGIRYSRIAGRHEDAMTLQDLYFAQKGAGFGPETKRRVILGTFVLSSGYYDAYYEKAQKVRALIKADFDAAFKEVDVVLAPVTPTPAFKIGEKTSDPLSMYLSDIFTIPANLAGLPAVSIPTKPAAALAPKELPVGFQLIGKKWREADILGIGQFYEKIG